VIGGLLKLKLADPEYIYLKSQLCDIVRDTHHATPSYESDSDAPRGMAILSKDTRSNKDQRASYCLECLPHSQDGVKVAKLLMDYRLTRVRDKIN